jgi:plastocyanin
MVKTIWGFSAWAGALIVTVSVTIALTGSLARAQTGWGDDSSDALTAKKVPPPPPPPPLAVAGAWAGNIQDSKQGLGNITVAFTEGKAAKGKSTLKGTWTITFPNAPGGAFTDVGTLAGSVTATAVALTLSPTQGDALGNCKIILASVEATQEQINGTYRFGVCAGNNTGTITLTPGTQVTEVFIGIGDDFFFPNKLTINRGQTVHWTNKGGEPHTVTSNPGTERCKPISAESFPSPILNQHDTFDRTFNNPGTFAYHCEVHGCMMKGSITVK